VVLPHSRRACDSAEEAVSCTQLWRGNRCRETHALEIAENFVPGEHMENFIPGEHMVNLVPGEDMVYIKEKMFLKLYRDSARATVTV